VTVRFGQPPVIYATTAEASTNRLITMTDSNSSAAVTVLATAAANEVFSWGSIDAARNPSLACRSVGAATVDQGQSAVFTITATGSGPLYYLWESNSTPLAGWGTSASVTLSASNQPPQSFPVEVLISNAWGTTMASATLTINPSNALPPAPTITAEPAGLAVNAGDTAVFSVGANGFFPLFPMAVEPRERDQQRVDFRRGRLGVDAVKCFWRQRRQLHVTITNAAAPPIMPAVLTVADPWLNAQPTAALIWPGDHRLVGRASARN